MSISKFLDMSVDEYLAFEACSSVRHEFIDGQVHVMADSNQAHNIICQNLVFALKQHLAGSGCQAFVIGMKVHIEGSNCFYYPDVFVTSEAGNNSDTFMKSPLLVVEVLSPSNTSTDLCEKLRAYTKLSSLREYVVVHQNQAVIEIFRKNTDDGWEIVRLNDNDELVLNAMPCGEFRMPVSRVYEDVPFMPTVEESETEYAFDS